MQITVCFLHRVTFIANKQPFLFIVVEPCCHSLLLSSSNTLKQKRPETLGVYVFHSQLYGRPVYKLVGEEMYIYYWPMPTKAQPSHGQSLVRLQTNVLLKINLINTYNIYVVCALLL